MKKTFIAISLVVTFVSNAKCSEVTETMKGSMLFGAGFLNLCKIPTNYEAVCFGFFLGQVDAISYLALTSNRNCNVAKLSLKPNCANVTGKGQIYDKFIKHLEDNPKKLSDPSNGLIKDFCFKQE